MTLRAALMRSTSFAHLSGLVAGRGKKAEDDEDMKDAKTAKDYPGDDGKNDGQAAKATPKDDDEDDDEDDADPDDEDEDEDEDEDDDEEMKKAKAAGFSRALAAARRAERARCALIFGHKAAAGRVPMAAQLAFGTDLSAAQAIAVLASAPAEAPKRSSLRDAMATQPAPRPGEDAGAAAQPASGLMAACQRLTPPRR